MVKDDSPYATPQILTKDQELEFTQKQVQKIAVFLRDKVKNDLDNAIEMTKFVDKLPVKEPQWTIFDTIGLVFIILLFSFLLMLFGGSIGYQEHDNIKAYLEQKQEIRQTIRRQVIVQP
jgi:hypothetical protein